jgi:hypothetical protein
MSWQRFRRLFWFAYTLPAHKDRELQAFQLRDGEASRSLTNALFDHYYRSSGCIINYPSPGPDTVPFDVSCFTQDDLLLMTTRPPIDDMRIPDKKGIPRSFTALEKLLYEGLLRKVAFRCCARSQILLTDHVASISPEIAARQAMEFRQNGGAAYQAYGSPAKRPFTRFKRGFRKTAAFLVFVEHAWPDGPALLAAFGVGGTETLVWCHQLQTRFADLLCTTSFVMAEMEGETPKQPQTLEFADDWKIDILGTAPLDFLERAKAA